MRIVLLGLGAAATIAMIVVSMWLNFLFGMMLGQTTERAQAFGVVSLVADCWKAAGPVFVYALARARQWLTALAAGALWTACFVYAVSAALGLAAHDRLGLTGGREVAIARQQEIVRELQIEHAKKVAIAAHRSVAELSAAIAGRLAQPVGKWRNRRTLAAASANCTTPNDKTVAACAEVATLRQELARAAEAERIEQLTAALRREAASLQVRGLIASADPQAEVLSRRTVGWITVRDIGFGLIMLLAVVIESVSAFGPVVLTAYADVTRTKRISRRRVAVGRAPSRTVAEYLAERIEPADASCAVNARELYGDYENWCRANGGATCSQVAFIREFDRLRDELALIPSIQKLGSTYRGLRIAGMPSGLASAAD